MTIAKQIPINIGTDELAKHVKGAPILGVAELIWNSLDANSTEIKIQTKDNDTCGIDSIFITDNGEGFSYQDAEQAFGFIGNSQKRGREKTNGDKRALHGSEGKGRLKALSIGKNVNFHSVYLDITDNLKKEFNVSIGLDNLKVSNITALEQCPNQEKPTGTKVTITNIEGQKTLFNETNLEFIEELYAIYYSLYKDFKIIINGDELDFESKIKSTYPQTDFEEKKLLMSNGDEINISLKIIEWDFAIKKGTNGKKQLKRLNLCSPEGCPLYQDTLGIETVGKNLSLYVMSDYIRLKQKDGCLLPADEETAKIISEARLFLKDFLNNSELEIRKQFVEQLKKDKIYPYETEPKTDTELVERDLFDIIAVKIDEGLPKFSGSHIKNKKLTLTLVKEAIANKSEKLNAILQEVCNLSDDEIIKFNELLDKTTLTNIIATTNEVINRTRFLAELREFVNGDLSKKVKERSQLHKIIEKEQWIFGEQYRSATSDKSLKTVLEKHIKDLDRDNLIPEIQDTENLSLNLIPDLCLWSALPLDSQEKREHLFIELKRPSQKATVTEHTQINKYAYAVSNDSRFTKDNTKWKFILVVTEIDEFLRQYVIDKSSLNGLYNNVDNIEVYIYQWSYLIEQKEGQLRRLKELLDINLKESPDEFNYLKEVHAEFLPTSIS